MATTNNLLENRVPPQALDAEMAVLGAMLLSAEAVDDALEILKPEHFYKESHQKIYAAIQALAGRGQAVDIVTLGEELKKNKLLTQLGGEVYLAQLVDKVVTTAHVRHYAEIVYKKFVVRDLIQTATHLIQRAYKEEDDEPQVLIDSAADQIYRLSQKQKLSGFISSKEYAPEAMRLLELAVKNKNIIQGVPTGLDTFDYRTGGLRKSDLIILGARPSQGKTALALNIAHHAAVECGIPVAFFSLEMGRQSIFERMLGSAAQVEISKLRNGWMEKTKWGDLTRELGRLASAPFYIDDTSGISITELRMRARRLDTELRKQGGNGLGLIVIDYLQLIRGGERRVESRQQEVSEISRMLKDLARTLDVPVMALSQLSRKNEEKGRADKKPMLSDLRESGSIEQDADVVALLHRNWYYSHDDAEKNKATLIIAKQRNGPVGDIDLAFFGEYALFTNPANEQAEAAQTAAGNTELGPLPE